MNELIKPTIEGELVRPSDMVRAVGKTHPLNSGRIDCYVRAGSSITEILLEALREKQGYVLSNNFVVHIDGHLIEEKNWSKVRVKKGATITFTPRLQGNSSILRSVLAIVVAVAATAIAGPLGTAFAASTIGVAIGISAAVATALIAGGIILAATMALNALFPTRPAASSNVESTTTNSIQGAQNQSNPFGAIPVVLGKHRQSPFFAAKPYTEVVGDSQYLRLLFCLGYGPLSWTDMKIGETPLTSFSDYEIEERHGYESDGAITLYPGSVDEVALSITLENTVDAPRPSQLSATQGNGTWESQFTASETDEISLDFVAPEGCFRIDEKTGNLSDWLISVHTRYRLVGAVSWTTGPSASIQRTSKPFRAGLRFAVTRGQYEVQATKWYGNAASDKIKDTVVWSAIRSFKSIRPISFPKPLALIALRIKATGQLSGVINTFNLVCTSKVKSWNGSTWVADTASQNPADLFRHVLQGDANSRPVDDELIDLENLQEWSEYCTSKGFKFNQIRNNSGSSVADALDDICSAGRAVKTFIDGKWAVVWDRPSDSIVQHFTPRNSWNFQGHKPYIQKPHGWRVSFINEVNGYTQDERIVYDDGYDSTNATLFEGIQFPGVTNPDLIWKHGRFHIAQARLRPEKITLNVNWENLVCTKGDRVRVTHDAMLVGLSFGRIKSIVGQVVTVDEQITIEADKTYSFQFRVPEDARTIDRAIDTTPAGDYYSFTLLGDLTGLSEGDLFGFGESDQESANYRIQSISPQDDLTATLTLVDDAPEISTADTGTIPEYDPHVSIPADPFALSPRDLKYQEVIDGFGSTVRSLVRLSWQVPRFGNIRSFEIQQQDDDIGGEWTTVDSVLPPKTSIDIPFVSSGAWSFRVRCMFQDGTASDWATLSGLSLLGLTVAPSDVVNLHQRNVDGQSVLDWNIVIDKRSIYYEIRKGSSWETGLLIEGALTQPPWTTTGDGTYWIRSYILSPFNEKIYSAGESFISITDSVLTRNIIVSKDEQAAGWDGGLYGGVIDGSFIRTDAALTVTDPIGVEVVDQAALDGLHIAIYVSSVAVDIGRLKECRFWTEFEASGILIGDDFLASEDVLGSGDALGTAPTRFIRAFPIWRFGIVGENDIFNPTNIFDPTDVFQSNEWQDWVSIASGNRVARFFQPGFVLITDKEDTNAVGTKFKWFVDVPDRNDDYTNLSVPNTGLDIVFCPGGYDATPTGTAVPFNGGTNGASAPHVQRAIIDGTNGDEVKITNLTLTGCTIHVVNAGSNVTRTGVNLLVRGY